MIRKHVPYSAYSIFVLHQLSFACWPKTSEQAPIPARTGSKARISPAGQSGGVTVRPCPRASRLRRNLNIVMTSRGKGALARLGRADGWLRLLPE